MRRKAFEPGTVRCATPWCGRPAVRYLKGTTTPACQPCYDRHRRNGTTDLQPLGRRPQPKKPCSVPGCTRPARALGLCKAHYMQQYRQIRVHKQNEVAQTPGEVLL